MLRILLLLCVALVGAAAEVMRLPLAPADQEFISDERKSAIPMPPGRGIVIVVGKELRWYGDDGARLHMGLTTNHTQVRHTPRGLAYPSSQGDLVLVDADGKETVIPDLEQLQLHTDIRDNLRAVSHVVEQGRVLQLVAADPWRLSEQEHPVMFEGDCYVLAEEPLTLAHIQINRLDMRPSAIIHLVRDDNVVWRSGDRKWSCMGILPSGKLILLSSDWQAGELAYVDMDGNLKTVAEVGPHSNANVIPDPYHQKSVVIVGDWRTQDGDLRAPDSTYRVRAFGEDGTMMHDFSRFGNMASMVLASYRVLFPSPSGNALVDPFSGKVLWSNEAKNFFVAPGERTNAHILVEQDAKVAWCFLFIDESPTLRIHPISDAKPSHYPVTGTGWWQFTGRDGSIWLYSKDSIYRITL